MQRNHNLNGYTISTHYNCSFASRGTWVQIEKIDNDFVTEQVGGGDRGIAPDASKEVG